MQSQIIDFIEKHVVMIESIRPLVPEIETISQLIINTFVRGNKLLICGNGGSAADSQHMSAELIVRFKKNRKALPSIALTTDTSILTATGNDFSFEHIFSRQVEGLGQKGDTLLLISTSGKSQNLILAAQTARNMGIETVALLGKDGGILKSEVTHSIIVPVFDTARIQEGHSLIIHSMCELIEDAHV